MNPKQSLFFEEWLLQKRHLKTNLFIVDIFIVKSSVFLLIVSILKQ